MKEIICLSDDIGENVKKKLYKMYIDTYKRNGLEIWFKTKEFMFIYPCNIIINTHKNEIKGFIMFQKREKINKISLIAHDNTHYGKNIIINTILNALNNGYVIEASGKLSWVLRKMNAPYIKNKNIIENILDIHKNKNNQQEIKINKLFNYNDRFSHHYKHIYIINKKIDHINDVTLFGREYNCKWTSDKCDRKCKQK